MKKAILSLNAYVLAASLVTTTAFAQAGAGGGGGAAGGGTAGGTGAGATAEAGGNAAGTAVGGNAGAGANVAVPPVREPLPPGVQGQTTPPQGVNQPGAGVQGNGSVNAGNNGTAAGFNGGAGVNRQGTNNNNSPLTPASRREGTNRVYGTNNMATNMMATNTITGTNGSGLGPQDIALTEFDRNLIIRFRATLIQRLGGTPAAWTPVTFRSDNGVFTVGGVVSSIVLKQRVLATLQTFPGVIRVNDQLVVDTNVSVNGGASAIGTGVNPGATGVNAGASATVPARFPTNALTPTGRPATGAP